MSSTGTKCCRWRRRRRSIRSSPSSRRRHKASTLKRRRKVRWRCSDKFSTGSRQSVSNRSRTASTFRFRCFNCSSPIYTSDFLVRFYFLICFVHHQPCPNCVCCVPHLKIISQSVVLLKIRKIPIFLQWGCFAQKIAWLSIEICGSFYYVKFERFNIQLNMHQKICKVPNH